MSKIAQAVQEFLRSMEWRWQELEPTRYRVIVQGVAAQWVWVARWDEDDSFFISYSFSPVNVPADRRSAAAEYLTRANYRLRLGNFELDYSDGEVSFKTSMVMDGVRPTADLVQRLAVAGFAMMDQYLPGLMSVVHGNVQPKDAIEAAERLEPQEPAPDDDKEEDLEEPPAEATIMPNHTAKVATRTRRPKVTRAVRKAQFADRLRLMNQRMKEEAGKTCFIRFETSPDAAEPARGAESQRRMIQILFKEKWFAIDLPNTTLSPAEAETILKERRGFYREAEHAESEVTKNANDLVQFDPVGKKYIYGDEQEAAEDAAYLFYDVWGLEPAAELLVTSSAFKGESWEKGSPLE